MATKRSDYDSNRADDLDAIAEASDSLMGRTLEDKDWDELRHVPRPRHGQWRRRLSSMSLQSLLNTILLVLVLALLFDRRGGHQESYGQFEVAGDITGFIPPVAQQIKSFVPDMAFAPDNTSEFFSDAVREKWLSIVPRGLGYVRVEDPSHYNNLPHPVQGYKGTVFTTSVTHQLHCLYNILEVYSSLNSGRDVPPQMQGHIPHCFEYLRQAIMCAGDTALEGQHTTFPDGILGSDGWDAKHVCKDYDAVYAFLEKNRADDETWI